MFALQAKYTTGEVNFESECKLPCNQVHFAIQTVKKRNHRNLKINALVVQFEDNVEVLAEHNNYNVFDLMVEVGSSLGLWIGLSALGIFDLIFEVIHTYLIKLIPVNKQGV